MSDLPKQLPQEYWLTLSDLQKAEAAGSAPVGSGEVRRLRVKLAEMETIAGLEFRRSGPQTILAEEVIANHP